MTKTILITGGTRGIGRGVAERLAAQGNTVIVTSRGKEFDQKLRTLPGSVAHQQLDVTDEHSVARLFSWLDSVGTLDSLINNAGVGVFKSFLDLSLSDCRNVFDVNVTGAFLCSQHAARRMISRGGGRIINIGSIVDKIPMPGNAVYGTSKWALRGFSRTIAEELKDKNIRVSHVSLGAVYTEIWQGRQGFSQADMLAIDDVSDMMAHIACLPLNVRLDELELTPGKGVL